MPSSEAGSRRLARRPSRAQGTVSSERVNALLRGRGLRYLEVGVYRGRTLEAVRASSRVGVDPRFEFDVRSAPSRVELRSQTSDDFFSSDHRTFDAIFLDGLHESEQTHRDLVNALSRLEDDGFILIDDVVPSSECAAQPTLTGAAECAEANGVPWFGIWMGDVYRVIRGLHLANAEGIDFRTIVDGPNANPQTLVWFSATSGREAAPLPGTLPAAATQLTWAEAFRFGVPAWMRPASFRKARLAFLAASSGPTAGAS